MSDVSGVEAKLFKILSGTDSPVGELQTHLVGLTKRMVIESEQVSAAIREAESRLSVLRERHVRVLGAHNQAVEDLRDILSKEASNPNNNGTGSPQSSHEEIQTKKRNRTKP